MKFKLTLSPTECSIESDTDVAIHRIERKNGNWSVELSGMPDGNDVVWRLGTPQPAFTEVRPKVVVDGFVVLQQNSLDDDQATVAAFFAVKQSAHDFVGEDTDVTTVVSATAEITWRS